MTYRENQAPQLNPLQTMNPVKIQEKRLDTLKNVRQQARDAVNSHIKIQRLAEEIEKQLVGSGKFRCDPCSYLGLHPGFGDALNSVYRLEVARYISNILTEQGFIAFNSNCDFVVTLPKDLDESNV